MGNWTNKPIQLPEIQFDGDDITFTVKRLLVEDMLVLSKHFNAEKGVLSFGSPLEVCKTAQELFPKYVVGVAGLQTAEATPVSLAEFLEAVKDFYFVPLVGELFTALIVASTVKADERKNSEPPSDAPSVT